ncbi:hypothetical protein MLD38_000598 [Melastoma candidum]|uniref:Uncharacterized protein n=1 Tax=Melastoma candidum TaxID=119954 RepID=A0ACB9SB22_9MYRT|nr:hypothetical protein MLD38_000598 [Melastoma candidum]
MFSPPTIINLAASRKLFQVIHIFCCHFPDILLTLHMTLLRGGYRKPIDFVAESTAVNSKFNAATFARMFKQLDARGIKLSVFSQKSALTSLRNLIVAEVALLGQPI